MTSPPRWTPEQLTADAEAARVIFRRQRLDEPLDLYRRAFDAFAPVFRELIDRLPGLAAADPGTVAAMARKGDHRTAFRYLTAPPISEDDLETLADTKLSARAIEARPDEAARVRDIVLHILDPYRFPWIAQRRAPAAHERDQAVVASAALVAAQKVQTSRRMDAKKAQEDRVRELLQGLGFAEVAPRAIPLLDVAPAPGEFCGESQLGDTRADLVVRLRDRRVMPIECKVSNSAVNSFKRVNHEAAGKAARWLAQFGERQVVPSAVLSGVFNPANLETAQQGRLSLFWAFRLQDLADFVQGPNASPPG
jgi:hypothetical protein